MANAISFTGGTNSLTLEAGWSLTGNVAGGGTSDTLAQGGSSNASFSVSAIGPSVTFRNFEAYQKTGTSIWTLTGTTSATTGWAVNGGTLAISSNTSLGNVAGGLSFDGGTLQTTATVSMSRIITLNGGGGTFSPDTGTTLTSAARSAASVG